MTIKQAVLTIAFLTMASISQADEAKPPAGLWIIAPQAFHKALTDYAQFKAKDLPTKLVALEEVLRTSEGRDDPEKLKKHLYQGWLKGELGYVLLVGDADITPVRYMVLDRVTPAAFDYAFYPSDLYYADLAKSDRSFESWNAKKDGFHADYYGEVRGEKNKNDGINYDQIDYRPEIAVGRWPASQPEQIKAIAAKSQSHQQAIIDKSNKARQVGFVAVDGWVDCRGFFDELANKMPQDWKTSKLYSRDSNANNVVKLLNQGASLVLHAGHGQDDRWEGSLSVTDLARLKNAKQLPIVISAGCSTARFATLPPYEAYEDIHGKTHVGTNFGEVFQKPPPPPSPYAKGKFNLTGLGEQLVLDPQQGAIAYIGCNTGSQPCALKLLEGFVETLQKSPKNVRLGDCWSGAIHYYWKQEGLAEIRPNDDWYPASIFFQGMKFMVFGDPSLRL